MDKKYWGFALYIGVMLVFFAPIYITPFVAQNNLGLFNLLQATYAPTCHQLASRSLCYFQDGSIRDCLPPGENLGRIAIVQSAGITGYKFPVCARDLAIYAAMFIGAIIFAFWKGIASRDVPPIIFFIILLIPIAVDGGTQLIGLRESTNLLRLITGFIAGIGIPFYVIPILNTFVLGPEKK